MKKNKVVNFREAEKNARLRDFEVEKQKIKQQHNEVPKEELEKAMKTMAKATGKDVYIGTKKSPQSKVRFAQLMQENVQFLSKQGYLSTSQKAFLMDLSPYISFYSNSIVFDIKAKTVIPMNITELAGELGRPRDRVSKTVNELVKKGILAKAESGIEGNNAKAYSLFVNPHIIYAGDKDNVNEALQVIFHKAMKMKILKELPNRLF